MLTELTSAPDDKSIGIELLPKISGKVMPIPISILLIIISIADTCINTRKVSRILLVAVLFVAVPILLY